MPRCHIDHLAVTAPTLAAGAELVRQALGAEPQAGGAHARMGTHNLLLRLGDALYLEVIALDPEAPPPARPRWFGLDTLATDAAPALATWVARSADIHASVAACPESLGKIEAMRRGALDWLITIPADGALPLHGVAPALIEWQAQTHPAAMLQDQGLSLIGLDLFHPQPERIARLLLALGLDGQLAVHPAQQGRGAGLVAHIQTPQGPRRL